MSTPTLSIITATHNAADQLPYTIRSIREQRTDDFEWIVIDGASTDNTVNLIKAHADLVSFWVSEPDLGIYDAWNKACAVAKGEWLLFLGAGDQLRAPDTLDTCIRRLGDLDTRVRVAYGIQTLLSADQRVELETLGGPWEDYEGQWQIGRPALPPHGAIFHHRSLFLCAPPFDLRFPIASDSHFLLRVLRETTPEFFPTKISSTPIGGVSFRFDSARSVAADIFRINRDLGIVVPLRVQLLDKLRLTTIFLLRLLPARLSYYIGDLIRWILRQPSRWSVR
ncbi:glycosyltransferase family 2 protein [Thiorhodococcus minor]|uniref:Glycosyltransferase n=1 Tax=Thiorhodococcus minor TaxID=57489 RepID=A0A6M0JZT8_9GAMM|nr:glycosyltransferase [Thiorhodococcus minor]